MTDLRLGPFLLRRALSRGSTSVVHEATDTRSGAEVAVKACRFPDPASRERLLREAEILSRLRHPNVVPWRETGEEGGVPYFAMGFVHGAALGDLLALRQVDRARGLSIIERLARGVDEVHRQGVLHGDLKPSNVLVEGADIPILIDFGTARETTMSPRAGDLPIGTPYYRAPEADGGPATDIFALGVMLYEVLTGRLPFPGANPREVRERILTEDPVPPSRWEAAIGRDLDEVCLKALRRDPGGRYAAAGAMAEALRRIGSRSAGAAGRGACA